MKRVILPLFAILSACSDSKTADAMIFEDRFPEIEVSFPEIPMVQNNTGQCTGLDLCNDNLKVWGKITSFGAMADPHKLCANSNAAESNYFGEVDVEQKVEECANRWTTEDYRVFNDIWMSPSNISNFEGYRSFTLVRGGGIRIRGGESVIWNFVIEKAWMDCENRGLHIVSRTAWNESTLPDAFETSPDYREQQDVQYINLGRGTEYGVGRIFEQVCGKQDVPRINGKRDLMYSFGPEQFLGKNGETFKVDQGSIIKNGNIRKFWVQRNVPGKPFGEGAIDANDNESRISIDCSTLKYKYIVNNFDSNDADNPDKNWITANQGTPEYNFIHGNPEVPEYIPSPPRERNKNEKGARARSACFL